MTTPQMVYKLELSPQHAKVIWDGLMKLSGEQAFATMEFVKANYAQQEQAYYEQINAAAELQRNPPQDVQTA